MLPELCQRVFFNQTSLLILQGGTQLCGTFFVKNSKERKCVHPPFRSRSFYPAKSDYCPVRQVTLKSRARERERGEKSQEKTE